MRANVVTICFGLLLTGAVVVRAQTPDIALSESVHTYANVAVGDSADWILVLYNEGSDTLFVDSVLADPAQFKISSPAFPDTILHSLPKDSVLVTVWFVPSDTGVVVGSLLVFSDDPDEETLAVALSGTGVLQDIALSDSSHDCGDVRVGDSLDWVLTIYNEGSDSLTVDSVLADPAQFKISSPTFPDTIPSGDSVQVTVWFVPSDTGAVAGTLWIFSDDPDEETLAVALSGTGVLQDIALSDISHDYGNVLVGDSLDWALTIHNEGSDSLTVDSILVDPAQFKIGSPTLPDTIPPDDSIRVTIWFVPTDTGAVAGSLLVFSNDPDEETLSVSVTGTGVTPDIALSDTSHDYGSVSVGNSLDWILRIYNNGSGILTVDSVRLAPSEFRIVCTSFPRTIAPDDSLGVTIRFAPTTWGGVSGSLLIFSDDADEETLSVALTGNGLAPDIELPVTSHDFGDVVVGSSAEWIMEICNVGNADLIVDSILAAPLEFHIVSSLFPDTVAPSDTLDVTVTFAPSDTGAIAGSLTVFSNDPDEVIAIALSGNGLAPDIALSNASHDFGDVLLSDSLEWELRIFNLGTADLILDSMFATPAEFEVSAPSSPDTLAVGDTLIVTVTFIPADTGVVSGTLVIYSSDPDEGVLFVNLFGRGVVPDILLFPESLDVTVWEGGIVSEFLKVKNEGTALLVFEMRNDSSWLSENPDSGGIDPQETLIVEVIFDATFLTIGAYDDTIRVISNDPDEPEINVPVHLLVREAQVIVSVPDAWSLPGATVLMTMDIDNQTERTDPISAFESHFIYEDTLLTVLDVTRTLRLNGYLDWDIPEPGRLIIVFVTSERELLDPDIGPVVEIVFEVSTSASVGESTTISLTKAILSDSLGNPIPVRTEDGTLFLGTGLKGDVNMDHAVNVLDVIWIVNYILERIDFTPFQFWAADCNEDGEANILDVVGIINVILEIGTCPPTPSAAKEVAITARIWSPCEKILQGTDGFELPIFVDCQTDIAGVQLRLSYDPAALILCRPQRTDRTASMVVVSNVKDGELTVIMYSTDGTAIPAGSGPILTVSFAANHLSQNLLRFEEVILAASCTHVIPVVIEPIRLKTNDLLPEKWSLEQNCPNPFNPATSIQYSVVSDQSPPHVTLKIYNLLGQEVRVLVDKAQESGYFSVTWDGKDSLGNTAASGVYFYRLTSGSFTDTKRMVLMK